MVRITLRLDPTIAAQVEQYAKSTGVSQNRAINELIAAGLNTSLPHRRASEVADAARDAVLAALGQLQK